MIYTQKSFSRHLFESGSSDEPEKTLWAFAGYLNLDCLAT